MLAKMAMLPQGKLILLLLEQRVDRGRQPLAETTSYRHPTEEEELYATELPAPMISIDQSDQNSKTDVRVDQSS